MDLNPPEIRRINLDPEDWYWATWRDLPPLEAKALPFDRKRGLERLAKVISRPVDYRPAKIASVLDRTEAQFWLRAILLIAKHHDVAVAVEALSSEEPFEPPAPADIFSGLQDDATWIRPELIVTFASLYGRVRAFELVLAALRLITQEGEHGKITTLHIVEGLKRVVAYMSHEEKETARELVRAQLDPSQISEDLDQMLPIAWYLAAILGLHEPIRDLLKSWQRRRSHPRHHQLLVFGLGSAKEVQQEMKRLKLELTTVLDVRAWLAHTEFSALRVIRDSILKDMEIFDEHGPSRLETLGLAVAPETAEVMLELELELRIDFDRECALELRPGRRPDEARRWLDENPTQTVLGLIPVAGRPGGKLAEPAVQKLLRMRALGHGDLIASNLGGLMPGFEERVRSRVLDIGDDALPVIESEDDASEEDTGMVTFYRLQRLAKPAQAGEVNRILGQPVGVAASRWPQYRGQPMHHVLTLDLDTAPELRRGRLASKLAGTRAIALFVSDTSSNEAWEPGTKESAVVLIDEAEIAANPGETSGKAMSVVAEQVPASVFGSREPEDSEEVSKRHGLGVDSYAGGGPIWLQGAEHRGSFVLQFSEELVPMNLGDGGEMYVFLDTAFWQCF